MITTPLSLNKLFRVVIALLTSLLLESCGFSAPKGQELCELRRLAVPVNPTASSQTKVFESSGTLVVYHGSGCAESRKSGTEDVVTIKHSLTLPAYPTQATVFLNGWDLQYLGDDQHVAALGTLIDSIRIDKNILTWQATGAISDKDFQDSYQWCYRYTVIAWNPTTINLIADHHDGENCAEPASEAGNFYAAYNNGTTTALSSFLSFLLNKDFSASKAVAILPRGFGLNWGGYDDHHLRQISYNRGHSEIFIEHKKPYHKMGGLLLLIFPARPARWVLAT